MKRPQDLTSIGSLARLCLEERNPDQIVAVGDNPGTTRRWSEFVADVTALVPRLREQPTTRWALYAEDAYEFAVGLLGLFHADKVVILPPNAQPGTLTGLATHIDGLLGDVENTPKGLLQIGISRSAAALKKPPPTTERLSSLDLETCRLELFTSGSTGQARCIPKQLAQIDTELAALDELWGAKVRESTFFSTVSQQHIYGLLFRVCWPLVSGRPFWRKNLLFPATLVAAMQEQSAGKCTLIATPSHLERLATWLDLAPLAPRLAALFSSGGPLAEGTAHALAKSLGQPPHEVLGSSETGGVATRQQQPGADASWTPLPHVDIRISEAAALSVRSPYAPGRGHTWYDMGDCAEIAKDGRFRLLGRRDHIVKIAEKRLNLPDLEQRLAAHPFVTSCAALMTPREGQQRDVLGALVVLSEEGAQHLATQGARATHDALRKGLGQHFERVLLPKRWRYIEAIPEDALGKRPLQALRALFTSPDTASQEATL